MDELIEDYNVLGCSCSECELYYYHYKPWIKENQMNLFDCEVCGNKDPQDHEDLIAHILSVHTDYTEAEVEYFSNLWEQDKIDAQEAEIYEPDVDEDPL